MSAELTEDQEYEAAAERLRRFTPSNYHTPKVVEHRRRGLKITARESEGRSKKTGQIFTMRRKVHGVTGDRYISLHRDLITGAMWWKCLHDSEMILAVKLEEILSAIQCTQGIWVTVTMKTEQVTVDRAQLKAALRFWRILSI